MQGKAGSGGEEEGKASRGQLKAAPGIADAVGGEIPGGFAGDLGGPFRGEDDPARRAQLVSETGVQRWLGCEWIAGAWGRSWLGC